MKKVPVKSIRPGHVFRYKSKLYLVLKDPNDPSREQVKVTQLSSGRMDYFSGKSMEDEVEYVGSYHSWDERLRPAPDTEGPPQIDPDTVWDESTRTEDTDG